MGLSFNRRIPGEKVPLRAIFFKEKGRQILPALIYPMVVTLPV